MFSTEHVSSMATQAIKTRFNKNYYEQSAWRNNELICGIDEVGRGCLAGPVVVASVVLFPNKVSRHLKDSKIMTHEEREKAARWIMKNSWYSIGIAHHRTIDTYNIYQTTLKAMKRSYLQLMTYIPKPPKTVVVDAMPLNLANTAFHKTTIYYFPFGESKSSSIAAASILAKISRDYLMAHHFETIFPGYRFASHKGYATPVHKNAVHELGHSLIHRISYLPHVYNSDIQLQQTIEDYLNAENEIDNAPTEQHTGEKIVQI